MGIYHCEKADAESIVLRHEGDDDHTVEVHAGVAGAAASGPFAPVPSYFQAEAGKRYMVSLGLYEQVPPPPPEPAEEPAPQAQAGQEAADEAQADTGSDQPSEAATGASEPSTDASPDAGGQPAAPDSEV